MMLGGVMGGYCASGRLNTETAPARVMTMDSTVAKMGRSMKKRENMVRTCRLRLLRKRPCWDGTDRTHTTYMSHGSYRSHPNKGASARALTCPASWRC